MRRCEILLHGVKAAVLTEYDNGTYEFVYDTEYLGSKDSQPVSLTMPLQKEPYISGYLFPFFANLLSEGDNRKMQAAILRIDPEDDFGILLASAQFDTIGAVTVKPVK